jgi:hypothetical protein
LPEKLITGLIECIKNKDWLMVDCYIEELKVGDLTLKSFLSNVICSTSYKIDKLPKRTCNHCMGFGDYTEGGRPCEKCGGSGDINNPKMSSITNGFSCHKITAGTESLPSNG